MSSRSTARNLLASASIVLVLLATCSAHLEARPLERTLRWDELPAAITNHFASMVLPDGTRLRGVAREVRADALVLDVRRSSNGRLHPHGRTEVPRASVSVIDMYLRREPGGQRGAAIGAGVGAAVMSPVAFAIGEGNIAPDWVAGVAIGVGIVGGTILGHRLFDRDRDDASHVHITVVAPSPQPVR